MKGSKIRKVTMTLKNGNISYAPYRIMVYRGDQIEWECKGEKGVKYHIAVHIGWDSPLDKGRYRPLPGKKVSGVVLDEAKHGSYKYFVAISDGKNIWTDDPEVIVRRRQ